MASALAHRSPADQYLVRRIAARDRVDVESLAALPAHELDRLLPGCRATYLRRAQVAHALLNRRGIDLRVSGSRRTGPRHLGAG